MAHGDIEIRIDRVELELAATPSGTAAGRALVEAALARLGERLAASPFGRRARLGPIAIERVSLGELAPEDLLGPRGAERIADELYAALVRRLG